MTQKEAGGAQKQVSVADESKFPAAKIRLDKKLSELEKAQSRTEKISTLSDGRIWYYEKERPAKTQGVTRGNARVTEYNPKTGQVRSWEESYNHTNDVTRVHPKSLDGSLLNPNHYPLTALEKGL